MRRSRPPALDASRLEQELAQLQERQREIRQRLRAFRTSGTQIKKLEAKLTNQLGAAKWTVRQIRELNPGWEELSFYNRVEPQAPSRRGRWGRQQIQEQDG